MAIPKIIHYCWFGNNSKPQSVIKCIESWRQYCPDYEIIEWNETNIDFSKNLYSKQAYDAKAWAFVPDYFRMWIVYNYGGIYLDTDVQVIKSLDSLLNNKAFAGFETSEYVSFGLGFGAEKGNELLKELLNYYNELRFINPDGSLNRKPAPMYITEYLREIGLSNCDGNIQIIRDMVCYPPDYFAPKDFSTGYLKITKNTYSIHQYDSSWYTPEEHLQRERNMKLARKAYVLQAPKRFLARVLGKNYQKLVCRFKK